VYRAYYGGKNLDILENKENPENTRFPEDWLASVTEAFNPDRKVENEGLSITEDGKILRDIIEENKEEMIGKRDNMSLLLKLLDSCERLVIQAHPTVAFAKEHFNSDYGKTECWYILNDGGEVYIGFKEGITKEYWRSLFESQDTEKMLDCLHKFEVKKGDFIFVKGGVPHAIGKNCFLAELQEPTDLMVIPERVTPSGVVLNEQKLHCGLGFEKMFDCFVYDGMSKEKTKENYFLSPKRVSDIELELLNCDMFRLSQLDLSGSANFEMNSYGIAVVADGNAKINGINLSAGDRIFISENEGMLSLSGNATVLVCRP
jgi:mannose-6-phosphate isomerase